MKYPAYVYVITLEATGKQYVGLSSNVRRRISQHRSALRRGSHPVEDMQTDYNRAGGSISFCILEEVRTAAERCKEFKWQLLLKTLERNKGYNYKDPVTRWCLPIP